MVKDNTMFKFFKRLKCLFGLHEWEIELMAYPKPNTTIVLIYEIFTCKVCGSKKIKHSKGGKNGYIRKSLG